jgi:AcrR family transcriptional regulator
VSAQPAEKLGGAGGAPRRRVPAAERREELIAAAVHEFARGGLHGTPVALIARRVGVAQPYVFTLFADKRELFIAAVERGFDWVSGVFERAAADFAAGRAPAECEDALKAMGHAYLEMLSQERDYLMLQLQSYAACEDPVVRARVRRRYAELVSLAARLSGAEPERLDQFFQYGMALNIAAAMEVEDISADCPWVHDELAAAGGDAVAAGES